MDQPGRLALQHPSALLVELPVHPGSPNEHLYYETPYYNYAVVIDYNTRNAPGGVHAGGGSAFFLHVTDGAPTAGCVAIPQTNLVAHHALAGAVGPPAHPHRRAADPPGCKPMSAGAHLVEVHDHLRAELEQLRDLLAEVLAGRLDPAAARSEINAMTLRQNDWTLGFYCARYCRTVTTHHAIEDASVFPHLRSEDPSLAPVLDRLQAEHRVIHDLLEGIDRSLVAFVSGPDGAGVLRAALDALRDALLTHLSYEEDQLVEPLSRFGFY